MNDHVHLGAAQLRAWRTSASRIPGMARVGMGTAQGRASTNPVRMLRTVVLPAGTDRHEKQHRDRVFDVRNRSMQQNAKRTERRAT